MGAMKAWVLTSTSASSCSALSRPAPCGERAGSMTRSVLNPAFQPFPSQRRHDLPTSVKGESGEFPNLSLHPSCLERDSIKYSQLLGRVLHGATLSLHPEPLLFPSIAPGLMEAKDNPGFS